MGSTRQGEAQKGRQGSKCDQRMADLGTGLRDATTRLGGFFNFSNLSLSTFDHFWLTSG
jgi:hypothetical protein